MAEIKMSYIFIEKQKHESKTMREILLEIIDNTVETRDDEFLKVDNVDASYRIIQKKNSKRCFLEMTSKERVTRSIPALQKIDKALFTSNQQRYYHSIRDYDGISENFCKKLYPKYAEFERKLRSLVLFILTKAYGSNWRTTMLANSEFVALLKQANTDSSKMAEVIGVSEAQLRFVTNTASGMGLIKCGSVVIPFDNQISKDTDLYRLYNTNIHEKIAEQKKKEAMLQ